MTAATYKAAGVDIAAGEEAALRYVTAMTASHSDTVQHPFGGFAGAVLPDTAHFQDPVFVSATDGVGTKLLLAIAANDYSTIGQDLVAMCANDLAVYGAEPRFFLDYFATGKLEVNVAERIVASIARACTSIGCSLIGGETAELPGMYRSGEFDLAGFCVGVAERNWIEPPVSMDGCAVIGFASSGLHSNGYSLARRIVADAGLTVDDVFLSSGDNVGSTLLEPTRLYTTVANQIRKSFSVAAMAHITGGGLPGNLNRITLRNSVIEVDAESWVAPQVFADLAILGGVTPAECFDVFNMGIGFVAVVNDMDVENVITMAADCGHLASQIGVVRARRSPDELSVQINGAGL